MPVLIWLLTYENWDPFFNCFWERIKSWYLGPQQVPQQTGASSEQRFSSFGLGPGEYKNNFGNQPNYRPVKFPKFPNFGKTPKFKPIKFPKIPSNFGGGGYGGGGRVGVGHTNSPFGYLRNLLRVLSYLVSWKSKLWWHSHLKVCSTLVFMGFEL